MNDEDLHHQAIKLYSQQIDDLKALSEYLKNYTESNELDEQSSVLIESLCSKIAEMIMRCLNNINEHAIALGLQPIEL